MYEHRRHRPISRRQFRSRILGHLAASAGLLSVVLGAGVLGYHFFADLPWVDALLNASMILGGMGQIDPLHTDAAKVFASFYALFSGLVVIAVAAVMLAPFVHRMLHRFHWEDESGSDA